MKKIILVLIFCSLIFNVMAQIKAVTETGEEVILFKDGTWIYQNEKDSMAKEIPLSPKKYKKNQANSFLLKSSIFNVGFWINPKQWSFKKANNNEDSEYELSFKKGDLYGMIITEKVEIPLETMKLIALENGRAVSPDLRIVKEEYRMVNGIKVLFLQMNGTTQGIKFSYYGYYYSNENGTVQFITYTSQNLMKEYTDDCKDLLNGIVELKK